MTRLLRHKLARFRKEEDGTAMVEFAMVCLFFFFLIIGAI